MPTELRVPQDELPGYARIERIARDAADPVPELLAIAAAREGPTTERVVATRLLARSTPSAGPFLDLVLDDDPQVRAAALDVLGQRGDGAVLERLRHVDEGGTPFLTRRLALARALIAHREGLVEGPFLPVVDGVPREFEGAARPEVRDLEDPGRLFDRLDPGGYGLETDESAYELRCGSATHVVFLDRRTAAGVVFRRPVLLGVVAHEAVRAVSVEFLVLGRPWEHGARIEVVRPDGIVVHTGTALPVEGGFSFDLSDTGFRGVAATRIAGTFVDRLRVEAAQELRRGATPSPSVQDARPS